MPARGIMSELSAANRERCNFPSRGYALPEPWRVQPIGRAQMPTWARLGSSRFGLGVFTGMLDTVRTKEFLLDIGGL